MPRKIRELITELEAAGWRVESGGKGSHRSLLILARGIRSSPVARAGLTLIHYQEKLVKSAVREIRT